MIIGSNQLKQQFKDILISLITKYIMLSHQSYLASIQQVLNAALCLRDFPSQLVEKDNKPYVELTGLDSQIDYLILKPVYLARNKKEQILIQSSINSCRVSFTIKKNDQIEKLIAGKFSTMIAARAELFQLIRRKPIQNYDVTFLITNDILQKYHKQFVIALILDLIGTLQRDLLEIKLNINTQCRIAATYFIQQLSNPQQQDLFE